MRASETAEAARAEAKPLLSAVAESGLCRVAPEEDEVTRAFRASSHRASVFYHFGKMSKRPIEHRTKGFHKGTAERSDVIFDTGRNLCKNLPAYTQLAKVSVC